jgi:hypothetical protein
MEDHSICDYKCLWRPPGYTLVAIPQIEVDTLHRYEVGLLCHIDEPLLSARRQSRSAALVAVPLPMGSSPDDDHQVTPATCLSRPPRRLPRPYSFTAITLECPPMAWQSFVE